MRIDSAAAIPPSAPNYRRRETRDFSSIVERRLHEEGSEQERPAPEADQQSEDQGQQQTAGEEDLERMPEAPEEAAENRYEFVAEDAGSEDNPAGTEQASGPRKLDIRL